MRGRRWAPTLRVTPVHRIDPGIQLADGDGYHPSSIQLKNFDGRFASVASSKVRRDEWRLDAAEVGVQSN
jgi:hypothetical protein